MGMKEWREIDGFPNYMASNTGEIKSLNYNKTGKEKVLIPHKIPSLVSQSFNTLKQENF